MNAPSQLRRLVMFGAPLPLIIVGLTHPRLDSLGASLALADEHMALHMALIPLFGLIGLAGYLLTNGVRGRAASISRGAMLIFVVLYTAYVAIAGISLGLFFHAARGLTSEHQIALYQVLQAADASPVGLGVGLAFFGLGTLAWLVGMIAAAVALKRSGSSVEPLILLVLAGLFLVGDHSTFLGSIAFCCFLLAAVWLEYAPRRRVIHPAGETA